MTGNKEKVIVTVSFNTSCKHLIERFLMNIVHTVQDSDVIMDTSS